MSRIIDFVPEKDADANSAKRPPKRPPADSGWQFHDEAPAAPTPWLIKNLLPKTGAGLISGQWGSYKTTVALDVAVSVMSGVSFANKFAVRRQGGVAYLALEGAGGLASRLTAMARERGVDGALPFAYRADCPPLTADGALGQLITMVEDAAVHLKDKFAAEVVLVFIDTLVTAAGYSRTGDENDDAAQRVMATLAGLSQHANALVLGLDHFGKVDTVGTRGSSAKEGAADVVLALLAERALNGTVSNTRLAVRKLRDGSAGLDGDRLGASAGTTKQREGLVEVAAAAAPRAHDHAHRPRR